MNKRGFQKGHIPWSQGKPLPEATKRKISIAKSGFKHSEEFKKKKSEKLRGINNPMYGKKHSKSAKEKVSKANRGENHPLWGKHHSEETRKKMSETQIAKKGGIKKHQCGYIYILNPNHQFCTKDGYVFEHRLTVEAQIGRHLKSEEACHHINKIKDDNRPENLMAFSSNSAHRTYENGKSLVNASSIIFDGRKL